MDIGLMMAVGKSAGSAYAGHYQKKSAKRIASAERATAKLYDIYNQKQVVKSYENSYANSLADYAQNRLQLAGDYANAQSKISVYASEQGANLSQSSAVDIMENDLDLEFNDGMDGLLTNNMRQLETIASNAVMQQLQLDQSYNKQINAIDDTVRTVEQNINDRVMGDISNVAVQGFDAYQAHSARKQANQPVGDDKLKELLNFSFTGGNL